MIIGIPRARAQDERRVALPPRGVRSLTERGHEVMVERGAGLGAGFADEQYEPAGARIVQRRPRRSTAGRTWSCKVGRPAPVEYELIREEQILMASLHLAVADAGLVDTAGPAALHRHRLRRRSRTTTATCRCCGPCPRSPGAWCRRSRPATCRPTTAGWASCWAARRRVPPAEVVVIGAGTVGRNAVRACVGAGARVTLLDTDFDRISELDWTFPGQVTTFLATEATLRKVLGYADVVVGAVLIPGARTPHLVTKEMIGLLRDKSLVIDISVDQGGCFETSRPTRLSDPTYVVDGITHYCVPNLPSLVARSASYALANALLPHVSALAEPGRWPRPWRPTAPWPAGVNIIADG